ncbi:uncharacterized protein [Amphiura filiformis]|uniref:uncharacterized protein n=1 Tax=Amphiura filiformis TaxID=82378 RepID=UPI003B21587D
MNLFADLRKDYGQPAVLKVRNYENCERKLARYRNHRIFTLRCRDLDLTPPSLRLKCPINTNKARDIVNKPQKELLRERLRVINNKIHTLESNISSCNLEIQSGFPDNVRRNVEEHIAKSRESEFTKTKCRQTRKLEWLQEKPGKHRKNSHLDKHVSNNNSNGIDLSGTQLKKWVIHKSKHDLTTPQTQLLAKGLNYAVAPDNNNALVNDYIVATEEACVGLSACESAQLRAEVVGVLKSTNNSKPNLTKDEEQALKDLKKDETIMILPADKGKATVVLDKGEYEEKVKNMLDDDKTYEKLKNDPTARYKRKLVSLLSSWKKDKKITERSIGNFVRQRKTLPACIALPTFIMTALH